MRKFIDEFKAFALKGNVVDLAVGVVIGAAFGKIVTSLVNDIVMPPIGLLTGGVDFSDKKIVMKHAVTDAAGKVVSPEVAMTYGKFINNVIDFLIVALAIFFVIKLLSKAKRKPAPPEPNTEKCPLCLSEIPIGAHRCKFCTADLRPAAAGAVGSPAPVVR